jgi:hypothetical protein
VKIAFRIREYLRQAGRVGFMKVGGDLLWFRAPDRVVGLGCAEGPDDRRTGAVTCFSFGRPTTGSGLP